MSLRRLLVLQFCMRCAVIAVNATGYDKQAKKHHKAWPYPAEAEFTDGSDGPFQLNKLAFQLRGAWERRNCWKLLLATGICRHSKEQSVFRFHTTLGCCEDLKICCWPIIRVSHLYQVCLYTAAIF
jgi:hypothetical protein